MTGVEEGGCGGLHGGGGVRGCGGLHGGGGVRGYGGLHGGGGVWGCGGLHGGGGVRGCGGLHGGEGSCGGVNDGGGGGREVRGHGVVVGGNSGSGVDKAKSGFVREAGSEVEVTSGVKAERGAEGPVDGQWAAAACAPATVSLGNLEEEEKGKQTDGLRSAGPAHPAPRPAPRAADQWKGAEPRDVMGHQQILPGPGAPPPGFLRCLQAPPGVLLCWRMLGTRECGGVRGLRERVQEGVLGRGRKRECSEVCSLREDSQTAGDWGMETQEASEG
ncbi:hypothetical protein P7K49_035104 [Saguinus oedipus]|uniref:Uncharacterized protein n=1 Tax=Saguinus oedipus TaxID=9490 RepID=A0ABQ9TYE4_SAGOE|nr:hypothetical protein P7K49_035104 [Saguinus oedipus]